MIPVRAALTTLLLLLIPAGIVHAQEPADEEMDDLDQPMYWYRPAQLPEAAYLMAGVRAALPRTPLSVHARLRTSGGESRERSELHAQLQIDWGADEPTVDCRIRDAFGGDQARLVSRQVPGVGTAYTYYEGASSSPVPPPNPQTKIADTEITWADLSFDFLWWPGGKTTGSRKVRGRFCYLVDIPIPEAQSAVPTARLWVDGKSSVVLRAEALNAQGEPVRSLDVKSLKKVGDLWTIKDMEVRNHLTGRKTAVRVGDVTAEAAPAEEVTPITPSDV